MMDVNIDIIKLKDTFSRLQSGCESLPGILNDLLASETGPIEELKRRLQSETAAKDVAYRKVKALAYEINHIQSINNEEEQRQLNWKISEYNNEKAKYADCQCKENALKNQIKELQNAFNNLKHYVNMFMNNDYNYLVTAKSGVNSLIHTAEEYLDVL